MKNISLIVNEARKHGSDTHKFYNIFKKIFDYCNKKKSYIYYAPTFE